jgi:hypothetical protein
VFHITIVFVVYESDTRNHAIGDTLLFLLFTCIGDRGVDPGMSDTDGRTPLRDVDPNIPVPRGAYGTDVSVGFFGIVHCVQ